MGSGGTEAGGLTGRTPPSSSFQGENQVTYALPKTPLYLDTRTSSYLGPMMTGTGISRDYCGTHAPGKIDKTVQRRIVCSDKPDDHHYRVVKHSCHDLLCPICWPTRAAELAHKAGERVWAFHEITQGNKPSHWSFNMAPHMFPSEHQDPDMLIRKVRDWGVTQAKAAGIVGALVQPHLWRLKPEYSTKFAGEAQRRNVANKNSREQTRKWNRYDIAREQSNWRQYVNYSPHCHIIGYGYLLNVKLFKPKFGFVYRKHGNLNTLADVQACINYLLSHVPLAKGVQVYSFFGKLGYNQMVVVSESETLELCQDCGKPMMDFETREFIYQKTRIFNLRSWLPVKPPAAIKKSPGDDPPAEYSCRIKFDCPGLKVCPTLNRPCSRYKGEKNE